MFSGAAPIPVIQVSIPTDLRPETQFALGAALAPLRSEGVLVVAGGLTVHTFRDFSAFSPETAKPQYRAWEKSIVDAVAVEEVSLSFSSLLLVVLATDADSPHFSQPEARRQALFNLVHHPSFVRPPHLSLSRSARSNADTPP